MLTLRVESSSIGAGGGQIVLTLSPTCPVGPCSTEWTFQGVGNTGTADRRGSSYRGTGSGGFLTLDCSGATTSTVTVEFRVRQAHTVGGAWRATEIAGTITESVPSVSNCLSAWNVWSFRGSAQG